MWLVLLEIHTNTVRSDVKYSAQNEIQIVLVINDTFVQRSS